MVVGRFVVVVVVGDGDLCVLVTLWLGGRFVCLGVGLCCAVCCFAVLYVLVVVLCSYIHLYRLVCVL